MFESLNVEQLIYLNVNLQVAVVEEDEAVVVEADSAVVVEADSAVVVEEDSAVVEVAAEVRRKVFS